MFKPLSFESYRKCTTKKASGIKRQVLALMLLVVNWQSYASDKVVTIASLKDYAPLVFVEADKALGNTFKPGESSTEIQGFSWDVVRESFHEMGYTIDLVVVPWARAVSLLQNSHVDLLFPTGKNSERLKLYDYSNESVNEVNYLVYVDANNPINWTGLESLRGLTIGVKRGFNYGNQWNSIDYVEKYSVGRISEGFGMLSQGRIDGFLGYEMNWDYVINKHGWQSKYKKLAPFATSDEFMVALKSNPKGKSLLQDFDEGKRKLIQSGRFEQLKKKWFAAKPNN